MDKKSTRVTIELPIDLYEKLKAITSANAQTLTGFIRLAINEKLTKIEEDANPIII